RPPDLPARRVARDGGARAGARGLVEALILAGGKAERLGDAAGGLPKPLVEVAGRPIVEYQIRRLAHAGVDRVLIACRAGQEERFEVALAGVGADVVAVGAPEPLGRGGGLRHAAQRRPRTGTRASG